MYRCVRLEAAPCRRSAYDIKVPRERFESMRSRLFSVALAVLWCHTTIILCAQCRCIKADLYSTCPQVRFGVRAKYDVIAVLTEVRFECVWRRFAWQCAWHFCNFPHSSASEDARVLGDSSRTCTFVPAFVWNRSSLMLISNSTRCNFQRFEGTQRRGVFFLHSLSKAF